MSCETCPRVVNGWFRGCLTAATTLAALPVIAMILSLPYRGLEENLGGIITLVLFVLPLILILVCLLSGCRPHVVILFGEALRIRSVLFCCSCRCGDRCIQFGGSPLGPTIRWGCSLYWPAALAGIACWFAAGKYAGEEGAA